MIDLAKRYASIADPVIFDLLKLTEQPDIISFAGGTPAPATFPSNLFQLACRMSNPQLQYSPASGTQEFRVAAAKWLSSHWKTEIHPQQILITSGSQQALDIIARTYLNPGDTILVEDPTYFVALYAFNAYSSKYQILNVDHPPRYTKAKLIYLVPTFQNPTGLTLNPGQRKHLAQYVIDRSLLLVEDDPYSQLYFHHPPPPPIYLQAPSNVIYVTSLSKIVGPALRLGLVVAAPQTISHLARVKAGMDLCTSAFLQQIAGQILSHPDFLSHLVSSRDYYRRQSEIMLQALKENLPDSITWTCPSGGIFIWLTLPSNLDSALLYAKAISAKVAFTPGYIFRPHRNLSGQLRLTFATATSKQIELGVSTLASLINSFLIS